MRRSSTRRPHNTNPALRRLERAAGRMNPYLLIAAMGLALFNLIFLALHSSQWVVTRLSCDTARPPMQSEAAPNHPMSPSPRSGF